MLRIKKMRTGLFKNVLKKKKIIIILKHFPNEAHKILLDILRKGITSMEIVQKIPTTIFHHPKEKEPGALVTL